LSSLIWLLTFWAIAFQETLIGIAAHRFLMPKLWSRHCERLMPVGSPTNHLLLAAKEQYRLLVQNSHGVIYEIQPEGGVWFCLFRLDPVAGT
jgi:hypothetical protein